MDFGILIIVSYFLMNLVMYARACELSRTDFETILQTLNEDYEGFDLDVTVEDIARKFPYNTFPGTKWCGPGDAADHDNDLGIFKDTDNCCRAHDTCDDVIPAKETKYNLTNYAIHSRLSCDCDERFRKCLRDVNGRVSNVIGNIYFNLIGTQCFKEDLPVAGCKRKGGWRDQKCVEYNYTEGPKVYNWFDVPNFCD